MNPYTRLKNKVSDWADEVLNPTTVNMFRFANASTNPNGWRLDDVYQRIEAAKQLGYKVEVRTCGKDIEMWYVKNAPRKPWELQ
jgi:hypothetical protein